MMWAESREDRQLPTAPHHACDINAYDYTLTRIRDLHELIDSYALLGDVALEHVSDKLRMLQRKIIKRGVTTYRIGLVDMFERHVPVLIEGLVSQTPLDPYDCCTQHGEYTGGCSACKYGSIRKGELPVWARTYRPEPADDVATQIDDLSEQLSTLLEIADSLGIETAYQLLEALAV